MSFNSSHKNLPVPLLWSLLTAITVLSPAEGRAATADNLPRVVVNILVDQLRTDYMNAFIPLYGEDGFVRLLKEGRVYTHAEYPHAHPDRASAAATLATGTTPYNHGVVGLRRLDRATLRPVRCAEDPAFPGVQTSDAVAPTCLGVSTVSDELKVATEGKALVYSIAPYRDAAILSAGHAADCAIWLDDKTGRWCTTSYYASVLPAWVNVLNSSSQAEKVASLVWTPYNDLVGNFSYFLSGGMKKPFAHKFQKGENRFAAYKTALDANFMQIDEVRFLEHRKPLGLNYVKLGLQDVLYDPKTNKFYVPNMNQSGSFGEIQTVDPTGGGEQNESGNSQ